MADNIEKSSGRPKKSENLGGRPKKADKYKKEREEILNKLNNILGITDDNKSFYIYDIDTNKTKQDEIMDLKDDVEKYFTLKFYKVFSNEDETKRNYLSLIKLIYKEMKITLARTAKTITRDGKSFRGGCFIVAN